MSFGESLRSIYSAAAAYMDKIKKGANPGELPVAQPTRFVDRLVWVELRLADQAEYGQHLS